MANKKHEQSFENLGYFLEFWVDGKFIGTKNTTEKDREIFGYDGRTTHQAQADIIVEKRKIKKGVEYMTIMYPLCGKAIKNQQK